MAQSVVHWSTVWILTGLYASVLRAEFISASPAPGCQDANFIKNRKERRKKRRKRDEHVCTCSHKSLHTHARTHA
eukprot:scaffold218028_cov17-Tisochrysis_lutea.AAC.1